MPEQEKGGFDWAFLFMWLMATTWGWLLGSFVIAGAAMIVTGLAIAILQWFVLKSRMDRAWRWILATSIAWGIGFLLFAAIPAALDFVNGFVLGAVTGIGQWLFLRKELQWAGWWIPISALAWSAGLTLMPGILLSGIWPGLITGIALEILLRHPKSGELVGPNAGS